MIKSTERSQELGSFMFNIIPFLSANLPYFSLVSGKIRLIFHLFELDIAISVEDGPVKDSKCSWELTHLLIVKG